MTIKKFQGKTEAEAVEKARAEFGAEAVIMNVKEIKPRGFFKSFKSSTFEVTAAVEEKESHVDSGTTLKNMQKMHETINMAADEPISIPPISGTEMDQNKAEKSAIEFLKRNASLLKKEDMVERERIEEKLKTFKVYWKSSLFPTKARIRKKKRLQSRMSKRMKISLLSKCFMRH